MKRSLLLILITFTLTQFAHAQNKITGTITDEKDQPMAGANVVIKGKVTGGTTDSNGSFEINTSLQPPLTLVVSMVGYQKQEIEVQTSSSPVTAKLLES